MPKGLMGFQKGNKLGLGNKYCLGKKASIETRLKMSTYHRNNPKIGIKNPMFGKGEKCHFWKDGRCKNKKYISWLRNKRNRLKYAIAKELGGHTYGDWELLKKQYNYTCPCCHKSEPEIKLTEDHIIPLSKGGSDLIDNIQPLCKCCNSKKRCKIITKFDIYGATTKNTCQRSSFLPVVRTEQTIKRVYVGFR